MKRRPSADDIAAIVVPLTDAIEQVSKAVPPECEHHLDTITTFVAVMVEVLKKADVKDVRAATQLVWIKSLMDRAESVQSIAPGGTKTP